MTLKQRKEDVPNQEGSASERAHCREGLLEAASSATVRTKEGRCLRHCGRASAMICETGSQCLMMLGGDAAVRIL